MPKPNFLIVGAQKAASTALLDALRRHPEVWMPDQEDPFLRDPVFDKSRVGEFLARYESHSEPLVGLKCPDYLARPEVAERAARILGPTKLIMIVREPVARAVSAYYWHVRWGALPVVDPEVGIRKVLDGSYRSLDPTVDEVLEWGLYHRHLARYLQHFAREDILVIHDQDLRERPRTVLSETLAFLGATQSDDEMESRQRNEGVYDVRRLRFLQLRNRYILEWTPDRSYYTIFKPSRAHQRLLSNGIAAIDRWLLARIFGNAKPHLSRELSAELVDYYREDALAFEELLGRSFPSWPSTQPSTQPERGSEPIGRLE